MGNMVITTPTLIPKLKREQTKSAAIFMKMWSELFWKAKAVSFVGKSLLKQQNFGRRWRYHIMWTAEKRLNIYVLGLIDAVWLFGTVPVESQQIK